MTSTRPTNNIPEVKGKKSRTYEFVEQNPLLKRCADPIYDPIRDPTHPVHEECDIPLPGIEDAHADVKGHVSGTKEKRLSGCRWNNSRTGK